MGPNAKQRSRKQYVNYRLRVLRELRIPWPSQEVIDRMKDETAMTEIAVDNVFTDVIRKSASRPYLGGDAR